MVFNGDANDLDAVSDINFWCSTDEVTYPLADKVRNYVFGLAKTSARIMKCDGRWKHFSSNLTKLPIAVYTFTAGQDNIPLDTKHLKILRVRFTDRNGVYQTLDPVDRKTISDDILNNDGDTTSYDKIGFSILPFPVPDYGGTCEIEYQPDHAVDTPTVASTDWEPGFNPDFHRLPNLYASEDYCSIHARERLPAIREKILEIEALMDTFYEDRDEDDEPQLDIVRTSNGPSLLT